ncbi:Bug family tripartite tricarboxylate transporter substrate binding protein [Afifella pfennigii]|uniref:Bug family tripartite tricarboxylate transporter substrate binding protein n=1 Tax=Afifella pfennigii TaxID=209897 RepID=UPI00047EF110|nr:tripartite tricarboxylate transporter substrate binding protein [Afifella pfennigii]
MLKSLLKSAASLAALAAPLALSGAAQAAGDYPSEPVELVCTTSPGSGAAAWCNMMAEELKKPDYLGVPVNVVFKSAGSNHEPVVYVANQPADGYTIMHMSGSFPGYFNLPHFTKSYDDFQIITRVEQTLYGIAVRCDDPDIKSWKDLAAYAKANAGELAMGSNKVGSIHHRHHVRIADDENGAELRFVPYQGTGGVVKDVVGEHLRVGFAQPGKWNSHIEAGTICPILILNEERLDHPLWKDVPSVPEVGMTYDIPHQWQGFLVKKGTPNEIMDTLAENIKKVTQSDAYAAYMEQNPHVIPNFEDDRQKLSDDFYQALDDTRKFMIDNGMIDG